MKTKHTTASVCQFAEAGIRSSSSLGDLSSCGERNTSSCALLILTRRTSDAVVVRFSPAGLSQPLGHEEGQGAKKTHHDQDEQLPVQQQVVTVEEGQSGHDGLERKHNVVFVTVNDTTGKGKLVLCSCKITRL